MNYLKSLVLISALFLFGCQKKEVKFPEPSQIFGLASPVRLNPDSTHINLQDYFEDVQQIDSVTIPVWLSGSMSADKNFLNLVTAEKDMPHFMVLKVWENGFPYSILLKKSEKKNVTLTFDPKGIQYNTVSYASEINGWNPKNSNFVFEDGKWQKKLLLDPGRYQYQLVVDGKWMLDPSNNDSVDNNIGGFNSLLVVGETSEKIPRLFTYKYTDGKIELKQENNPDKIIVFWQNYALPRENIRMKNESVIINIPAEAIKHNRSWIRVWSENEFGVSNDVLIPLDKGLVVDSPNELTREDWEASVFYFLMVDRFKDGDTTNDFPVKDPDILPKVNFYGGDLAGVTQKINDGYFEDLGINTIWISPISQNPLGAFGHWPDPETKFSGYHGYWPISSSKVDFRFGTSDDLKTLIKTAHDHNMNIVLDYVAHHIHIQHPIYKEHPDWFTQLYLPDGSLNTERWDEYRLTTWFDTFLPTLNLSRPDIVNVMVDSALFWVKTYGIDGYRHDATKHIPELFWRTLTKRLKDEIEIPEHKRIYQIGETYGGKELIGSYVGSGMLDGQFDFNVYDKEIAVFGRDKESFEKLSGAIQESLDFYGYHNLMGYITGNQDRPRFISLAGGSLKFDEDSKMAGWQRDIEVGDPVGYKKLQMLTAFNMTIPGIPTIYYGDEFGMPGANDPDNRRMMKFSGLNPDEQQTKEIVTKLVHLRRNKLQLTFGDYEMLLVDPTAYAFIRTYFDKIALVVFNKSQEPKSITVTLPEWFSETNLNANFGSEFSKNKNEVMVTLGPESFEILTNE